jgi:hypothetical protein
MADKIDEEPADNPPNTQVEASFDKDNPQASRIYQMQNKN